MLLLFTVQFTNNILATMRLFQNKTYMAAILAYITVIAGIAMQLLILTLLQPLQSSDMKVVQ